MGRSKQNFIHFGLGKAAFFFRKVRGDRLSGQSSEQG
jgi:hypothetical protein